MKRFFFSLLHSFLPEGIFFLKRTIFKLKHTFALSGPKFGSGWPVILTDPLRLVMLIVRKRFDSINCFPNVFYCHTLVVSRSVLQVEQLIVARRCQAVFWGIEVGELRGIHTASIGFVLALVDIQTQSKEVLVDLIYIVTKVLYARENWHLEVTLRHTFSVLVWWPRVEMETSLLIWNLSLLENWRRIGDLHHGYSIF